MQILEWSLIIIAGTIGISSVVASIKILYKMKDNKDGFWRP